MKFSLCMIVKNESAVLANCLDSLKDIMDEIIIVDTGSTDNTKEIAEQYTPYVYDFEWKDDFAAARNFAFSKASGDYIYSADADEVLDRENQNKLKNLKRAMMPEVEIVQMVYVTEQINHPTENFARDMRPKLLKDCAGLRGLSRYMRQLISIRLSLTVTLRFSTALRGIIAAGTSKCLRRR